MEHVPEAEAQVLHGTHLQVGPCHPRDDHAEQMIQPQFPECPIERVPAGYHDPQGGHAARRLKYVLIAATSHDPLESVQHRADAHTATIRLPSHAFPVDRESPRLPRLPSREAGTVQAPLLLLLGCSLFAGYDMAIRRRLNALHASA